MTTSHPAGWTAIELAQAAVRGQLELHYQLIVGLHSDQIASAGALLRQRHPTLGLLPPDQLLPMVESSDPMPEVGTRVPGAACRQMREQRKLARQPFRLAVNVSTGQVGPGFDGWVKDVLTDAESPAGSLEIELTESVTFGNPAIFPVLEALRRIGMCFAADDSDTDYSCLQHLEYCLIAALKIDQSLVAGLVADHRDRTIMYSVIQLAYGLSMDVVAEGVGTPISPTLLR